MLAVDITHRTERALENHVFPGCVIGVVEKGHHPQILPFGTFTYEAGGAAVLPDSIYDLASVTKSIPTASLALQLLEIGALGLDDLLIRHVPEFNNSDRGILTIKHLLTYTLGGYALSAYKDQSPEELYETLMTHEFSIHPGEKFSYSNIAAFLLGRAIESVMERPLEDLAQERFFGPLHMNHSTFRPAHLPQEMIAPSEIEEWRGHVRGSVHDESAYVFTVKGNRPVGHAGLFSNVPDLCKFLDMLLHGGEYRKKRYFSEETMRLMETNQIADLGESAALGWELQNPRFMGTRVSPTAFGKTGFTGTSVVIDRTKGKALVILSNRTYPRRASDSNAIQAFRADIADIVFG